MKRVKNFLKRIIQIAGGCLGFLFSFLDKNKKRRIRRVQRSKGKSKGKGDDRGSGEERSPGDVEEGTGGGG